jgi:uncharacterized protein YndB with AHSA1/START domain
MSRNIDIEFELPHPPEAVWRALTDPRLVADWLMKNNLEPKVGHKFQFTGDPIPGKWDGIVDSEIRVNEPMRRLSFTWNTNEEHSTVDISLEPTAHGTRLRFGHHQLADDEAAAAMEKGWNYMLRQKLPQVIAKQQPPR